jgi:DNA ligase-1
MNHVEFRARDPRLILTLEVYMKYKETLYKRDSKGKIREWFITVKDDTFTTHHGLKGGKVISKTTICNGKNKGRANATTDIGQAKLEAAAKYTKRLEREGYSDDINNLEYASHIQPMLARDYVTKGYQLNWGNAVYGSPKLDGVRAIWVHGKGFQSRKGTFYKVPHLEKLLAHNQRKLDGELYIHGKPLNEIVAACRKPNHNTPKLEFRIFDVVDSGGYIQRFKQHVLTTTKAIDNILVQPVPYIELKEPELDYWHDRFVDQGYEGLMLRVDGPYKEGQRSVDLFKYKKFQEAEYKILGVKPDKDGNGVLQCDGFDVRMKGPDKDRRHQIDNPRQYIGRQVTVRYFTLTPYGKPQFPVGIVIRDY